MPRTLGIELSPTRCSLVVLSRRAGRLHLKTLSTVETGSDEPERLGGELRRLRRAHRLPKRARVVVWSAAELVPTADGDYRDRVDALRLAGLAVEAALSPPEALAAVAANLGPPVAAAVAYLAVNPDGVALAVVRDGELLLGQELESGPIEDPRKPDRRSLARRLGAHVVRALRDASAGVDIERLMLCGALSNLRSLTLPLSEALARPVETLDTLEGIDASGLTMPILDFQKQVAGLRLAWAMAADGRGGGRLPPHRARSWIRPIAAAGLLTAAAATIVVACWPARGDLTRAPRAGLTAAEPIVAESPATPSGRQAPPSIEDPGSSLQTAQAGPPAAGRPPAEGPSAQVRRRTRPAWKVRSILIGPERRLALVDGRIVGPGDRVDRETVIEIADGAVILADGAGRRRRVELQGVTPGVVMR